MARLLGYMSNRVDRLRDAFHQERGVIAPRPENEPVGWGIGFYQGGEVLHKKRPLLEGEELDWAQIASNVRSDCVIVHLRHATVGDYRSDNMHPFRMRSWLFAHNGTIQGFDAIRERLTESMPDFLQRNIRGETDSEHFFHLVLSFLHDEGQLDNPDVDDKTVIKAIRSATTLVDRLSAEVGAPKATLNVVLTNGRRMFALRRGHPLMYVARQGIHDPIDESEPTGGARGEPSAFRYVLLLSDSNSVPADYQDVPEDGVVVVSRDLDVEVHT